MQIGFVGLGQMGKPIALNLLKGDGADLVVLARRDEHLAEFRGRGAQATKALGDLAGADILFLCLPDGGVVREVLFGGAAPLADKLRRGSAVVDLSTITYGDAIEIGKRLDERGIAFPHAPIPRKEARAIEGTLTVMCGGRREAFDRVRPYLGRIGTKILFMGPSGSGQLTKLINQLLFDVNAAALAEVLPMAAKMGLNPELVGEVVNSGTGRSYASEFFIPRILAGRFSDGYPMAKAYKDLVSGAGVSAELGIPMPVLAAATATYQAALLRGHGDKDKGGMVRVFEELLGVEFRGRAGQP